mgnify:CR=1 FL=1
MVPGFATKLSPSFRLVSTYFISAIVSLIAVCIMLLLSYDEITGHHFSPKLLAITHMTVLGWIALTIFGAIFQLISIILKVKLFSEKLAFAQYAFHISGMILLVYSFWVFSFGALMITGGSLIVLSVVLFLINMAVTLSKRKKNNLTGLFLMASNIHLFLVVVLGLLLAINLGFPFIPGDHLSLLTVHAHIGIAGWIGMVIAGVSLKLIPMFTLSHGFSVKPAWGVFILVNSGVLGFSLFRIAGFGSAGDYVFVPFLAAGFILFFVQIILIIKKRMKKNLDLGIKFSMFAYSALLVAVLLSATFFFGHYDSVQKLNFPVLYGFILIFGFITQLILGQMYKIIPFLIWFHYYSSQVGLKDVPLLKDLYNRNLSKTQYYITNFSILLIVIAILINLPSLILAGFSFYFTGIILFSYNILSIYKR